jgi:hypothetical protein
MSGVEIERRRNRRVPLDVVVAGLPKAVQNAEDPDEGI